MPFQSVVNVPQEVVDLVGKAMGEVALYMWWTTPVKAFNNHRPMDAWRGVPEAGTKQDVVDFIRSTKSGDMV